MEYFHSHNDNFAFRRLCNDMKGMNKSTKGPKAMEAIRPANVKVTLNFKNSFLKNKNRLCLIF